MTPPFALATDLARALPTSFSLFLAGGSEDTNFLGCFLGVLSDVGSSAGIGRLADGVVKGILDGRVVGVDDETALDLQPLSTEAGRASTLR
mmetsp:Transcript_7944/g.18600  ORF Transcript_7944/g.18600 Transcript_7944/m.18600 type:complete len:91 (+) Transcript_7944:291-563(+)